LFFIRLVVWRVKRDLPAQLFSGPVRIVLRIYPPFLAGLPAVSLPALLFGGCGGNHYLTETFLWRNTLKRFLSRLFETKLNSFEMTVWLSFRTHALAGCLSAIFVVEENLTYSVIL
jgi:hypothetical protein